MADRVAASEQPPRVPPRNPSPGVGRCAGGCRAIHRDGGGRRRAVGGHLGCLNAALIVNLRRASLSRRDGHHTRVARQARAGPARGSSAAAVVGGER